MPARLPIRMDMNRPDRMMPGSLIERFRAEKFCNEANDFGLLPEEVVCVTGFMIFFRDYVG